MLVRVPIAALGALTVRFRVESRFTGRPESARKTILLVLAANANLVAFRDVAHDAGAEPAQRGCRELFAIVVAIVRSSPASRCNRAIVSASSRAFRCRLAFARQFSRTSM